MPNTHTTLTSLFDDVADAIREKDGTTDIIIADTFPDRILAIPSGGDECDMYAGRTEPSDAVVGDLWVDSSDESGTIIPKTITANGTYNASADNADGYSPVTVNVPTGTQRSASDVTVSGATVSVPAGLYGSAVSKSVASGTAGTPTATKGTVSNHQVMVTPSVTNTTGYITGGTKTGTGVTVSASELVSGSETKTENGTYDVTNLASIVVNVSGGGGSTSIVPTSDTWQHNTYVTLTLDVDSEGNLSIRQSSGSGTTTNLHICYPQGSSTTVTKIPNVPTTPGTYEFPFTAVWQGDQNNHTLTYTVISGGGDVGKNVQVSTNMAVIKATTMTTTNASITVAKTGTYKCTWVHWAQAAGSSTANYSSQLYVANATGGSVHYAPIYNNATATNFVCTESNVSLTEGQKVEVRARSRGTSYYINAGFLVIEEQ